MIGLRGCHVLILSFVCETRFVDVILPHLFDLLHIQSGREYVR